VYIQAVENDLCAANINREEAAMGNPTIWARSHGLTRRAVLAAASSIAGAGVLARSRIAVAEPGKPIKIGAAMPLTGRYSREARYCVEG
jgi:hypothetical protein